MSIIEYKYLRPFSMTSGLPRLIKPNKQLNGKIEGNKFQYQPSDHPTEFTINTIPRNLKDYTEEELLYSVNEQNFRSPEFDKADADNTVMSVGCSHTYGIGIRDHEVWGSRLSKYLQMKLWNIGVGGIGPDACLYLVQQFFEEGYIPKKLAILWPSVERKLLITEDDKQIDDGVSDYILNTSTDNKNSYTIRSISLWQFSSFAGEFLNSTDSDNIKRAIKGQLLLSQQQTYYEFLRIREHLIDLCALNNVDYAEMFTCTHGHELATKRSRRKVKTSDIITGWTNTIDWSKLARDGQHFGNEPHNAMAKDFARLFNWR